MDPQKTQSGIHRSIVWYPRLRILAMMRWEATPRVWSLIFHSDHLRYWQGGRWWNLSTLLYLSRSRILLCGSHIGQGLLPLSLIFAICYILPNIYREDDRQNSGISRLSGSIFRLYSNLLHMNTFHAGEHEANGHTVMSESCFKVNHRTRADVEKLIRQNYDLLDEVESSQYLWAFPLGYVPCNTMR